MVERWRPQSLADLQSFIGNGHGEDHHREFKEQMQPRNERLARQLAGFAVDGGDIYYGVAESGTGFQIVPLELAGLPERVEQIAQARVSPPVLIEVQALRDDTDSSRGVLWIAIPPSYEAPHQVDGTYYERGDKQTRPMSDGAVERLMQSRRTTGEEINLLLEKQMNDDSLPEDGRPHVIGIARPIGAAPEELYEAVGGSAAQGWQRLLDSVVLAEARQLGLPNAVSYTGDGKLLSPRWSFLDSSDRKVSPGPNRHIFRSDQSNGIHQVSLLDDGFIAYASNAASDLQAGEQHLYLGEILGPCLDMIIAMRSVAVQTGRRRSWDIGFGVKGARGMRVVSRSLSMDEFPVFPDERYLRARRVNHLQLREQPLDTVRYLVRGFIEACGLTLEKVTKGLGYEFGTGSPSA